MQPFPGLVGLRFKKGKPACDARLLVCGRHDTSSSIIKEHTSENICGRCMPAAKIKRSWQDGEEVALACKIDDCHTVPVTTSPAPGFGAKIKF